MAVGEETLAANTIGGHNSALGEVALHSNTTGSDNTAVGGFALFANTSGNSNVAIGKDAGNNVICIGADVPGEDVSNSCFIGNIFGQTSSREIGVFINPDGKLGMTTSSQRFKEGIKPMDQASDLLFFTKTCQLPLQEGDRSARHTAIGTGIRGCGKSES